MKHLCILGSTGSIGKSTLEVVAAYPERFAVSALAAGRNVDLLEQQARAFRPALVVCSDASAARELERRLGRACRVLSGPAGLVQAATDGAVDLVVSAIVGAAGLPATYAALEAGNDVALANKEALVVAGAHMTSSAARNGAQLLPVDSEHNALHQCLRGESATEVRRVWLTASGGPFRKHSLAELARVTPAQALEHPTWKMGPKITIDSATLMNKGLEVIEARWLFGVESARIAVVVHPQSVVHSMVEFVDGSFKAQLGITDMRHPIEYALSWPARWPTRLPAFDPVAAGRLEFEAPDTERFPCLRLAYQALEAGGSAPAVLNAANEIAVEAFLDGRASLLDIPRVIEDALARHADEAAGDVTSLLEVDRRVRESAREALSRRVV